MDKGKVFFSAITSLFASVLMIAAIYLGGPAGCGGGGAAEEEEEEEAEASGGIVDENGTELTSVDTNDPVMLNLSGLTANTQYIVAVTAPDGTALSPSGGFVLTSDEDGNIPSTTIVQDLSTPADGSSLITSGGVVSRRKAQTGSHTIQVLLDSTVILTITFTVADRSRVFCSDADGVGRASFTSSQTVYVKVEKGGGTLADGTYTCYVGADGGVILSSGTLQGQQFSATVTGGEALVSIGTFSTTGGRDVVCDVDGSGSYGSGDLYARPGLDSACFTIQEEGGTGDIIDQICSDRNGNYRDWFDPDNEDSDIRDVWSRITPSVKPLLDTGRVCKYVVAHKATWTAGDTLTDVDEGVEIDPVQRTCINESRILIWPRERLRAGCYDCAIDADCDGVYDPGKDLIDNIDNTGDNTLGGFCVANPDCADVVSITSHTDGETVTSTAITLAGTVSTSATSGRVVIASGRQSQTASLSLTATDTGASFSATIPLFNGKNQTTVFITNPDGTICAKTIDVTSSAASSSTEVFRAQLTWTSGDDMDLHVIKPSGTSRGPGDCYYSNCNVGLEGTGTNSIDWGAAGEDDDPKLDVDCIPSTGCTSLIENIWLNELPEGEGDTYGVFVDAYSGSGTGVQVTISAGGTTKTVGCGAMSAGGPSDSCYVATWNSTTGEIASVGTLVSSF